MSKLMTLVFVAFVLAASGAQSARADDAKIQTRAISWEEFQKRCADPRAFPNDQTPILNAVISCTDTRKEYVSAAPADVPLRNARSVTYDVSSEKFVIASATADVPAAAQTGTCLRFKEVEKVYSFQRKVSCADILNIKGDLANFCLGSLDKGKNENPKGVVSRDTGVVVDTCAGVDHQERDPAGKGGKGGKDGKGDKGGKGPGKDQV